MKLWKALYVASRSEKKVCIRLQQAGLESYFPIKKEKRQWSDRKKVVITPLLNGYVFVNIEDSQRDEVFKAQGVLQYVRYNGSDAIIKEKEIDALKEIELKGYHIDEIINNTIDIGDKTIIKYGQFKGIKGIVERKEKNNTFVLQLESIGFSIKISLPGEVLAKSDE